MKKLIAVPTFDKNGILNGMEIDYRIITLSVNSVSRNKDSAFDRSIIGEALHTQTLLT
jgi:hypothetical protein